MWIILISASNPNWWVQPDLFLTYIQKLILKSSCDLRKKNINMWVLGHWIYIWRMMIFSCLFFHHNPPASKLCHQKEASGSSLHQKAKFEPLTPWFTFHLWICVFMCMREREREKKEREEKREMFWVLYKVVLS